MKKFLAVLNLCAAVAAVLCFLFCPVIKAGDIAYTGLKYLSGYSETGKTFIGTETTYTYLNGKSLCGMMVIIMMGAVALLSLMLLFTPKKMMNFGFGLTLILAVVCATLAWFLAVNDASFANYGDTLKASILLGTECSIATGAYVFLGCSLGAGLFSFAGTLLK